MNGDGTVIVTDCTFSSNSVPSDRSGGAINNGSEGQLTILRSHFDQNSAGFGGAIYATAVSTDSNLGVVKIQDSSFSRNAAGEAGGAVLCGLPTTISGCTFANNTAGLYGADIYKDGGTLTVSNNTFSYNFSSVNAGPALVELSHLGGDTTINGNQWLLSGAFSGGANQVVAIRIGIVPVSGGSMGGVIDIVDNELDGGGVDSPNGTDDSAGIRVLSTLPAGTTINIRNNVIAGFIHGIQVEALAENSALTIHFNDLSNNASKGIFASTSGFSIDATKNWWGGTSFLAVQSHITGNVMFDPWLGNGTDQQPQLGFQPEVTNLLHTVVSLDVNNDGKATALGDGLVILRYLFKFKDASLIQDAVVGDPVVILAYLNNIQAALDVDLNGRVEALTDGLVILRYLFDFRDVALTQDAVDPLGQRNNPEAILSYLDSINPGAAQSSLTSNFVSVASPTPVNLDPSAAEPTAPSASNVEPLGFQVRSEEIASAGPVSRSLEVPPLNDPVSSPGPDSSIPDVPSQARWARTVEQLFTSADLSGLLSEESWQKETVIPIAPTTETLNLVDEVIRLTDDDMTAQNTVTAAAPGKSDGPSSDGLLLELALAGYLANELDLVAW